MSCNEGVENRLRRHIPIGKSVARDEDDVGPGERVESVGDVVREPVTAGYQPGCRTADPHRVRHARPGGEDLCRDADIERFRPVEDEDCDTMRAVVRHG